jgi:hypothetical protein
MILTGHTEYDVINPEKQKKKKKYENSGKFKINFKPIQTYSFLQYLQSGVQVSLTVAVDFTGSNGYAFGVRFQWQRDMTNPFF